VVQYFGRAHSHISSAGEPAKNMLRSGSRCSLCSAAITHKPSSS